MNDSPCLQEITADARVLQDLFGPRVPNNPALWAVLKGKHTGKAVVDNQQAPSQCVLRTDAALTYFSTQTTQAFLNKAIAHYREIGAVWLVWPHQTALHPPELQAATLIDRLEFFGVDLDHIHNLQTQLPAGLMIQKIDKQLLDRCEWRDDMEFYAGSLNNFLANGLGLCMLQGNDIIVEAYASAFGKTMAEIGAITHEAYRGRGYAAIASAYLIEACQQRGYEAYWSCDVENPASIRVAQKLGFRHHGAYQIYEYTWSK